MKYAIVEAGGKQYRAEEGKVITIDLLSAKIGDEIVLDKVVLIVDGILYSWHALYQGRQSKDHGGRSDQGQEDSGV